MPGLRLLLCRVLHGQRTISNSECRMLKPGDWLVARRGNGGAGTPHLAGGGYSAPSGGWQAMAVRRAVRAAAQRQVPSTGRCRSLRAAGERPAGAASLTPRLTWKGGRGNELAEAGAAAGSAPEASEVAERGAAGSPWCRAAEFGPSASRRAPGDRSWAKRGTCWMLWS